MMSEGPTWRMRDKSGVEWNIAQLMATEIYDEIMQKAHELSCTHTYCRATECSICRAEFEAIARQAQNEHDAQQKDPQ